jgi:hypothetical protein
MPHDRAAMLAELLVADPEAWCRLKGAIAILALPDLHRKHQGEFKRLIEIQVEPGVWEAADRVIFDTGAIIFAHGVNGHTKRYAFDLNAVPEWRIANPAST